MNAPKLTGKVRTNNTVDRTPLSPLKVVIAPSGFKESLCAEDAASAIAAGVRRAAPHSDIVEVPLVDGGEGFTKSLVKATGGELIELRACGPIGKRVDTHFGLLGNDIRGNDAPRTAVIEMAAAAGLRLVPTDRRDPLTTTTFGVGELIKSALDFGVERILFGCGDSGTNDGGAGAVQALGVRLLKQDGTDIEPGARGLLELDHIDMSEFDSRLHDVQIDVACNIHNILCGPQGVARVFGPQKGASPEVVDLMEAALERYASIIHSELALDVRSMPGGGASGGLGSGLFAFLGARLHERYDIVMRYLDLDDVLRDADLVITAEGGIDFQTPRGKIPAEVARRAKQLGLPVIALAGTVGEGANLNYAHGIDAMFSMLAAPCMLEEAIDNAPALLSACAENVARTVIVGINLSQPSVVSSSLN